MHHGNLRTAALFVPAALSFVGCTGPGPIDDSRSGELAATDERHHSDGSFYDEHTFEAGEGYRIVITMESPDFDTFLHLSGPDGSADQNWQNDDRSGDDTSSRIECTAPESGTYTIWANSNREGEVGAYVLHIRTDKPG